MRRLAPVVLAVLLPNTWVPQKSLPHLVEHEISLRECPPIKPGAKDPYGPPN